MYLKIQSTENDQDKLQWCCWVPKSCLALCNPINCSIPGFPVLCLLELAQTHVHWWYHPTISSSVAHFSFCLQSFLASGSFPMSWLFPSSSQSSGASASASVLSMNPELISFKTNWFDLLSVKRTLKSLLQHHNSKASILWCSLSLSSLVAQMVKNLPAMWEIWVRFLGWEDPLEKGMAIHSSLWFIQLGISHHVLNI